MHGPGKMFRSFEVALHKGLVDNNFRRDICQLTSLPRFHLLSHGFEVSLHSIDAHRDAVDERERLRVFREHRSKHACDNVSELRWEFQKDRDWLCPRTAAVLEFYTDESVGLTDTRSRAVIISIMMIRKLEPVTLSGRPNFEVAARTR